MFNNIGLKNIYIKNIKYFIIKYVVLIKKIKINQNFRILWK